MDYMQDLKVDKYNLDAELYKQPILFMQYQEEMYEKFDELNDIKLEIDVIKNELKEVESELYLFFKNPNEGKSPTETAVESMVITNDRRKKAFQKLINKQKEFNKCLYEHGLLEAAVKSFEQRKKSLEKAVDLYISGYNSEVKQKKIEKSSNDLRERIRK